MYNPTGASGTEPVQVIAVTGGARGTGKTTTAINLATALANRGRRVMLMDTDLAAPGVATALGLRPNITLGDVIAGSASLAAVPLAGPSGVSVVPAGSGGRNPGSWSAAQSTGVIKAFSEIPDPPEVLVVDTASELSDGSLQFIQAAGEALIVLGRDRASAYHAHGLIRTLRSRCALQRLRVLTNGVDDTTGRALFEYLHGLVDADLDAALHQVGTVPSDPSVQQARSRQQPVVNTAATSPAARAFKQLARRTESFAPPRGTPGGVSFFVERLIDSNHSMQRRARSAP